ncbi:hypothetical protein PJ311_03835 [Bacillus sp. CLL-7-23]|uniref:MFS transporter n=1 Tax=Bacillus changyiensis TaxID=3004103 RepID=A0ABT4X0G1_9BACI|nr:hypothetical protein [Bacillus changyiensis]MDA7025743.1 hypothetical protein [Bacillus changyiensis]
MTASAHFLELEDHFCIMSLYSLTLTIFCVSILNTLITTSAFRYSMFIGMIEGMLGVGAFLGAAMDLFY